MTDAHPATDAPKAQAEIKATGRIGEVTMHDPDDPDLTYKIVFSDGAYPEADWFAENTVKILAGDEVKKLTAAGGGGYGGAAIAPKPESWAGRPVGTPVCDEHFICMGTKAPICPASAQGRTWGPITLGLLQGGWLGSGGAHIEVLGTSLTMNGAPLNGHSVELYDDGTVSSIGTLWQLAGWTKDGGIDFRCSSTKDNMMSARTDVWTRKQGALGNSAELERLKLLGYAESARNPLARGVEGCMPGSSGAEVSNSMKDSQDCALLQALISQWREADKALPRVRPPTVVPDVTNRAQTGLGVELVHFVASNIRERGFKKRQGSEGHDIPVLVREPPCSKMHEEALSLWGQRVKEEDGFPPICAKVDEDLFTSLGNGHFFQALNLFACGRQGINDGGRSYEVGSDANLAEAIDTGVPSIVLKHETPRPVRAKIAELLNSKRDFMWTLGVDGTVDVSNFQENTSYCSQFEWMSKGMDAVQVNCLVRSHLGIKDSKRIMG
jgi:hypothetical protein